MTNFVCLMSYECRKACPSGYLIHCKKKQYILIATKLKCVTFALYLNVCHV